CLLVIFFLLGGLIIFINVSAYLFKDGYDAAANQVKLTAENTASEIARTAEAPAQLLARVRAGASSRYQGLSLAYVTSGAGGAQAGPWKHAPVTAVIPAWLRGRAWSSTIALPPDSTGESGLVIRAATPVTIDGRQRGYVVADLPLDLELVQQIH